MIRTLLLAAAAATAPQVTFYTDARPPERFQGARTFTVQLTDQDGINRTCHPVYGAPPAGMKTDACFIQGTAVLPNPCSFPESDTYARMLCHELGHANGWPADHGP